jgi:uncharacterized protein (DUF3084 family)
MPRQTIRLYHRIAVDWVADTFGLRGDGSATARHDRAQYRAHTLARRLPDRLHRPQEVRARHDRAQQRAQALARRLPDRLHRPRQARILKSWQARIGQVVGTGRGRS